MVLDQAEDLHREPQPFARVGVAGGGAAPSLDVVGLDLGKDFLQQLTAQQFLGTRAAAERRLQLIVAHFVLLSSPTAAALPRARRR
jgi:hypothetical protein